MVRLNPMRLRKPGPLSRRRVWLIVALLGLVAIALLYALGALLLMSGFRTAGMSTVPITLPEGAVLEAYDDDGPGSRIFPWVGQTWYYNIPGSRPHAIAERLDTSLGSQGWRRAEARGSAPGRRLEYQRGAREKLAIEIFPGDDAPAQDGTFLSVQHQRLFWVYAWLQ